MGRGLTDALLPKATNRPHDLNDGASTLLHRGFSITIRWDGLRVDAGAKTLALTQARTAEPASYRQQRLAPYVRRIEEQAERSGTLEARLSVAAALGAALSPVTRPRPCSPRGGAAVRARGGWC